MDGRHQLRSSGSQQNLGNGVFAQNDGAALLMNTIMNNPQKLDEVLAHCEATVGSENLWKLLLQPTQGVEELSGRRSDGILPQLSVLQYVAWTGDFYYCLGTECGVNPNDTGAGMTYFLNKLMAYIPQEQRHMAIKQLEDLKASGMLMSAHRMLREGYEALRHDLEHLPGSRGKNFTEEESAAYEAARANAISRCAMLQLRMPMPLLSLMCEQNVMWDPYPNFNEKRAPDDGRVPMIGVSRKDVIEHPESRIVAYFTEEQIAACGARGAAFQERMKSRVLADIKSVKHNFGRYMLTHGGRSPTCDLSTLISNGGAQSNFDFVDALYQEKCKQFDALVAYEKRLEAEYRNEANETRCGMDLSP